MSYVLKKNRSTRSRHQLLLFAVLFAAIAVHPVHANEDVAEFLPLDLSSAFNADIFTFFNNRTDGQMDSGRASFPAEMMPVSNAKFKTAGVEFRFPSKEDGDLNAIKCLGQAVPLTSAGADYLYLLATAADGNQRTELKLTHANGTESALQLDVNDWCSENPGLGGVYGLMSDYRHTMGGKQDCKTSVWMVPLRLKSDSPLISIRLPNNPSVYVVAATLGPAGEERRIQTFIKDAFLPSREAGIDRLVLLEIVEPLTNARLRVLSDDHWRKDYREMETHELKEGTQSIPVWLPVIKERTYHFEIGGDLVTGLDETNLFPNTPSALIRLKASRPIHPADAGFGMTPAWHITALPETDLEAGIFIPNAPSAEMILQTVIAPRDTGASCKITRTRLETTRVSPISTGATIETGGLQPGDYSVFVSLLNHEHPYASADFLLTVANPAQTGRPFGARETDLDFRGPVWTNWDEAISYEEAWEDFTNSDIVIDFPGQPYRYVFWKGASYAPIWLFDKHFITLEWMEAWPRQEGAVDCIEPLQDKNCEHSRVALLSSTPARARVQWTYAETDFRMKIIHGEHAEEIYTIYPDGIGIRRVTGFFERGRWHEVAELINGSVAGTIPSEHYPKQAASLLNTDGDRLDLYWPTPRDSGFPAWNDYIGLVHSRNNPSVFLAADGRNTDLHIFSNNPGWLPEVFFCMPHWPIQRGLPTTNERSIRDCENRATHASLLNIYASPYECYDDHTVWALMVGIAPENEQELRDVVRGWLQPPSIDALSQEQTLKARYDIYQRGYVVRMNGANTCTLRINAAKEHPQVRPAIILQDISPAGPVSVVINGQTLVEGADYTAGAENGAYVIWLRKTMMTPTEVNIEFEETEKVQLEP